MLSRWRDRLDRLLTFNRARTYGLVLVALYIVAWVDVLVLGNPPLNSSGTPIGGDYIAFHAAGRLILSGHAAQLYDHAAVSAVQDNLLGGRIPGFYDAYRNPPFFALLFAPLALLDLLPAFAVFGALSLAALGLAIWLLLPEVPSLQARWWGLAILVLAFPPVYFGLIDGENATFSLLLYVLTYRALAHRHDRFAGMWAALGLFKPQLFWVFPLIFLIIGRWRALLAYTEVAAVLGAVSLAVVGTNGVQAWLRILLEPESGNATANAWRMDSLKAFFDLLLPGQNVLVWALFAVSASVVVGALLRAWSRPVVELPRLWAFTCLVAVLVDPHLVDYDLTVLVSAGALSLALVPQLRWWVVLLYGLLLLRIQVSIGDLSLQLAVPVLAWCAYVVGREIQHRVNERTR